MKATAVDKTLWLEAQSIVGREYEELVSLMSRCITRFVCDLLD